MYEDQYLDAHMEDVINGGPYYDEPCVEEDLWEEEEDDSPEEDFANYDSDYWSNDEE